ncbi:MAG: DUF1415 domain-containing protein [Gammaproteobacteria bacterium]|nr:DUF1415 domain-containing protein [Gammaproteobacteria bacterium]
MTQANQIIEETRCWLKSTIIGLNFCPFAKREFTQDTIRYSISSAKDLESNLHNLAEEFQYLDKHSDTETTLLMFSHAVTDFDDFLELIEYANQLLDDLGYDSVYQLAHFHPLYCFDGVELDDASNYTNRSPYPTLHIIRELSMQRAVDSHPDTAQIPESNIKLARELGAKHLQSLLEVCKDS